MNEEIRDDARFQENQFLTFVLGEDVYGLGILHIREILQYAGVTPVPMVPDFVRGVINLRGNVVPVIDLAARFGGPRSDESKRSCIVIVDVQFQQESLDVGVMVDAVNEVVDIPADHIEPAPPFGADIRTDFIYGMGRVEERFFILLEPDSVLSIPELAMLEGVVDRTRAAEGETAAAETTAGVAAEASGGEAGSGANGGEAES